MARRKNVKRIDPRYFLHETADRGKELEEFKGIPAHRERERALKGRSVDPQAQCRELQKKISKLQGDIHAAERANPHDQAIGYMYQSLKDAIAAAEENKCSGLRESEEE